jgi:hypothetical protein
MLYCDHPQYNVTGGADVATPGPSVRMSSSIKAQCDFGMGRWLADAGCGHDLVSTSLALKGGGKACIRVGAPKYLDTADGITSVTEEMTMHVPQLDEMAEIMCLTNVPFVISVGERCDAMEYAFFWPPFSEHPFFVKPDGARADGRLGKHPVPHRRNGGPCLPGSEERWTGY